MGKAHVVPAQLAEVSDRRKTIRLPLTEADVKNAPAFDCGADIDHTAEDQIGSYYQKHGYKKDVPATPAPAAAKGVESKEEARVQLKEGKLKVGKREVEYGGVRLRKVVRTEEVNKPVELKREEIVVERGSRNRPSDEIERCRFYRRRNLFPASPRRGGRRETILRKFALAKRTRRKLRLCRKRSGKRMLRSMRAAHMEGGKAVKQKKKISADRAAPQSDSC